MKNCIAALTATTVMTIGSMGALAPVALAAPAGGNATPGCVSQGEFGKVKNGMTMKKVHNIFGTKGKRTAKSSGYGTTIEIRSYETCTPYGSVALSFTNSKLSAKSGVF